VNSPFLRTKEVRNAVTMDDERGNLWKCRCGWIYAEITEFEAHKSLLQAYAWVAGETMKKYMTCMRCGSPSSSFVPAKSNEVPMLATLQPIVIQLPKSETNS